MLPESLRPFAKSVWPFVLTIVGVLGQVLVTGEFDRAETVTAVTGVAAALVAYVVPNRPEPPVA